VKSSILWALAAVAVLAGFTPRPSSQKTTAPTKSDKEWVVLISGNTDGYLSPCGCTKPMSGGIRRRGSLLRELTIPGRTVQLETGRFTPGNGPQDRLKAEAMADAIAVWKADAVVFTTAETAWPAEQQSILRELAGDRVLEGRKSFGPLKISGSPAETVSGPGSIMVLDGDRNEATAYAKKHPKLQVVVYRQQGRPDAQVARVGSTWLVTPGEKGKFVIRLAFRDGKFVNHRVFNLGPEVADDPVSTAIFRRYQRRVSDQNLIDDFPRVATEAFAGNEKCGSCHAEAFAQWKSSAHAHALETLEKDGSGRDPECVSCHVVGLESTKGFVSREKTPSLTDVGCESCHGPGGEHARAPYLNRLAKIGEKACLNCHTRNTSPNFEFLTYWKNIQHGLGKTGG